MYAHTACTVMYCKNSGPQFTLKQQTLAALFYFHINRVRRFELYNFINRQTYLFNYRSCFDWPKKAIEFHKNVYESVKKAVIQANRRVNQVHVCVWGWGGRGGLGTV